MVWKSLKISDIAEVQSGAGFPTKYQGQQGGQYPFYKVSDMNLPGNERLMINENNTVTAEIRTQLNAKIFPAGSIIFPKIGAAIATNKKRIATKDCCADNNVMGLIPKPDKIDSDFLYYLMLQKNLSDFASDSNPPSIKKTTVEDTKIFVSDIPEQKRIVEILKRAEGIVRLRREQLAKTRALIPALFIDMFGDPATNQKGWEEMEISKLVKETMQGTPQKRGLSKFNYIDIASVDGEKGQIGETNIITAEEAPSRARKLVCANDVIISTVRPNLRASAIVPQYLDGMIASTGFCVLSPQDWLKSEYLYVLIRSNWFVDQLVKQAKGASYPAVTDKIIKDIQIPVPPVQQQESFKKLFLKIADQIAEQSKALEIQEILFQSLLHHGFQGTLTAPAMQVQAA